MPDFNRAICRFREPGATITNMIYYKRNRPSKLGGASIRRGAFIRDNTVHLPDIPIFFPLPYFFLSLVHFFPLLHVFSYIFPGELQGIPMTFPYFSLSLVYFPRELQGNSHITGNSHIFPPGIYLTFPYFFPLFSLGNTGNSHDNKYIFTWHSHIFPSPSCIFMCFFR